MSLTLLDVMMQQDTYPPGYPPCELGLRNEPRFSNLSERSGLKVL
jgi:hypothetical protein